MQKPQQIIELEKELGFELTETQNRDDILHWQTSKIYLLNENQELIGLNLDECGLQDISFLQRFSNLQILDLGYNKIKDFPFLRGLSNLQILDLGFNQIQDILFLQGVTSLRNLDLSGNQIKDFSFLQGIPNLQILDLSYNQIKDISFLQGLSNLQSLDLGENQIKDISFLQGLSNLQSLDLGENQIKDISFLQGLSNLQSLYISGLGIQDISFLQRIPNLQYIDLSFNKIQDISFLQGLSDLQNLHLSNNEIGDISLDFLKKFSKLTFLSLHDNPIQNIPIEKLGKNNFANCLPEVLDYLKSIENPEDRRELNEAKLIFVGRGGVGKSELAEALSEPDYAFVEGRKSTEGIRIKEWKLQDCLKKEQNIDFTVNIWDFAGQEINYGTHQFFLTKSSLYILVWENRLEDPTHKISLEYWLNIIALLSNDSPVLIVQNKIDEKETDVPEEQLLAQFPNIKGFFKTSCKANIGISELYQRIKELIVELPHTSELWNKNRVAVRDSIETNTENYFTYSDYLKLCKNNQIEEVSAAFLAQQLHHIGILLHYADFPRLKDTVVLKPEWATQAAYKLIDAKLNPHKGYFTENDLERIWADAQFDGKRLFLLDLMKRFDLVFNMLGTDEYIVPDLLSIYAPKNLPELPQNDKLFFEYHYDFMPQGIMSRFICRNAGYLGDDFYIRENYFWRYGVYLQQNGAKAKVIMNDFGNAYIRMEVSGEHSEQFLHTLRSFMQEIHKKLNNPDFKEVIPCPCETCKKETEHKKRHYFEYKRLLKLKEKNKKFDICDVSYEDVSISKLLTGIEPLRTKEDEILENVLETRKLASEIKVDTSQILQIFLQEFSQLKQNISLQEEERFRLLSELIDKQNRLLVREKTQKLADATNEAQLIFPKFNSLQPDSQNFVAMGFYFLEILPDSGDFSPAALQFCRALELEMKTVFKNFKTSKTVTYANQKSLFSIKEEKDTFGIFYRFIEENGYVMLNQMIYVLLKINDLSLSNLFSDFKNYLSTKDLVSINPKIEDLKDKDYRNKSAHTHPIPKNEAEDCKALVLMALDLWV